MFKSIRSNDSEMITNGQVFEIGSTYCEEISIFWKVYILKRKGNSYTGNICSSPPPAFV